MDSKDIAGSEPDKPTIKWLREQLNPGNSPLVNFNIDRLLSLHDTEKKQQLLAAMPKKVPHTFYGELINPEAPPLEMWNGVDIDSYNRAIDQTTKAVEEIYSQGGSV